MRRASLVSVIGQKLRNTRASKARLACTERDVRPDTNYLTRVDIELSRYVKEAERGVANFICIGYMRTLDI